MQLTFSNAILPANLYERRGESSFAMALKQSAPIAFMLSMTTARKSLANPYNQSNRHLRRLIIGIAAERTDAAANGTRNEKESSMPVCTSSSGDEGAEPFFESEMPFDARSDAEPDAFVFRICDDVSAFTVFVFSTFTFDAFSFDKFSFLRVSVLLLISVGFDASFVQLYVMMTGQSG